MEPALVRTRLALAGILLLLHLPLPAAPPTFWDPGPRGQVIEAILAEMTDEEILGQVVMLGYIGTRPSPQIRRWIAERSIGGVKVFSRNVESLRTLAESIAGMQELAERGRFRIPLFIATDQEGGWVHHVKQETSQTPGNIALGASGLARDAYLTGLYIGEELRVLGINMNFAPTVDVYSNPEATVIGPRAFSSDPVRTGLLAVAYFKGLARSGVVAVAKHFPGHGNADRDSHGTLPEIDTLFEQLWERELLPYRMLIPEGLPAIMSGHLAYPRILGDLTPSSLSPFFVREVLRDRLGFQGLLVTDDMEMIGVLAGGLDTPGACRRTLEAGTDMVLVSHTPVVQEKTWVYLLSRIRADAGFREKVRESAGRVLRLKWQTFREAPVFPVFPEPEQVEGSIPSAGGARFFQESSLRSVTLIRNNHIPYQPAAGEKVLLVGQFEEFLEEGRRRYPGAETLLFPYSPFYYAPAEVRRTVLRRAAGYDTLIFCLANYNSLDVLKGLEALGRRIIVMSTLTPVYLQETPWVSSSLAVYGTSRESFRAGFAALTGDFEPEGRMPIYFPIGNGR